MSSLCDVLRSTQTVLQPSTSWTVGLPYQSCMLIVVGTVRPQAKHETVAGHEIMARYSNHLRSSGYAACPERTRKHGKHQSSLQLQ
jgi:hypothetical protein